jgi:ABC-type Fe3+/spermidine/putrescine transport system ATPase subunit
MDEPLSNLDAKLRADMRIELRELQHRLGVTSVYVTHDLEEALAMSDRIVVMRDGVIEQAGTPTEIYARPRNAFVADFVGSSNLVRGRLRPDLARDGLIALETSSGEIVFGNSCGRAPGAEPTLSIRTVHLQFSAERPQGQGPGGQVPGGEIPGGEINMWPVRVHRCVFQGDFTQIHVAWGGRDLVIRSAALEPIAEGQSAWIWADPARCVLLEGE